MKKIWLKALTLPLILATIASFTGCRSNSVEADANKTLDNNTQDNKQAEKIDLKGDTIKISMWWNGSPVDEDGKSLVRTLEEKYNCRIEYVNIPYDSYISKFNASILSGEPMADIACMEAIKAIPALVEADRIIPVDEYFDFNDPKWPSIIKQNGRYAGKQYGFTNVS